MNIVTFEALELINEFPFADSYETRDVKQEIADLFNFQHFMHYGYLSKEITEKYNFKRIQFLAVNLKNDDILSFNYNNNGDFLVLMSKKEKVFEYQDTKKQAWIKREEFRSFEGLNVLHTIQEYLNGKTTENLQEKLEGFTFDFFSDHKKNPFKR